MRTHVLTIVVLALAAGGATVVLATLVAPALPTAVTAAAGVVTLGAALLARFLWR